MGALQRNFLYNVDFVRVILFLRSFLLAYEGLNVLMMSLLEAGLFRGYCVGRDNALYLSHFQFVDDTLIIGEKN